MPSVLIYRRNFLPRSETFVADHIRYLRRWRPVPLCSRLIDEGNDLGGHPPLLVNGAGNGMLARIRTYQFGISPPVSSLLRGGDMRLMHAHFLDDGVRIMRLASREKLPLIVTVHGFDATIYPDHLKRSDRYLAHNQHLLQRSAATFICVSHFIRRELESKGYPADRLVVNPLGVVLDDYKPGAPASQRHGVLFAGRLVEKKGAAWLLRAWALLPPALRTERLTIIGGGGEEHALRSLAKELGIRPDFQGPQKRSVVREAMLSHRVFAFPSLRASNGDAEGMGVVAMEAQGLGAPVLAFDDGPAREVLSPGQAELLARPGDAAHYASLLAHLLTNDALADRLGAEGPAWIARNFDLQRSMTRLETIYDRIASGKLPS
jgi:glycosyltransferase involved in cell wall biosynthesis